MTRIDFYVGSGGADRLLLSCRLARRIRADARRLLIFSPDPALAERIDRLLWTFREDSFLPHGQVGAVDPALTPILISTDGQPEGETEVLLNLSDAPPPWFARFERVCEPLDQTPAILEAGRQRWSFYRNAGYPVHYHEVGGATASDG